MKIFTLERLKDYLNEAYGFDITRDTRLRQVAFGKKVFCYIAKEYGFRVRDIKKTIKQPHDLVIYHHKTFHTVMPIDLDIYNKCVEHFEIPLETIPSTLWLSHGKQIHSMVDKMKVLSMKDLKYFEKRKLDAFIENVKKEQEFKALGFD